MVQLIMVVDGGRGEERRFEKKSLIKGWISGRDGVDWDEEEEVVREKR